MDALLRKVGSETMIVKINHTWYKEKMYDLGRSGDSKDIAEFLHDVRAVTQFATRCEIRLVAGDAGDR